MDASTARIDDFLAMKTFLSTYAYVEIVQKIAK